MEADVVVNKLKVFIITLCNTVVHACSNVYVERQVILHPAKADI